MFKITKFKVCVIGMVVGVGLISLIPFMGLTCRGTKASKDFHIGSVSYKVSHYAKCTVIIVR